MKIAFYYLCFFLSAILPMFGQAEPEAEKREESGRLAWFVCTSIPDGLENPVMVQSGELVTKLELPRYMASAPVKISADGIIRIVREVIDPEDPGKLKYLVLAEAKIPEAVREAMVILVPLPKPEGDLVFQAKVQDLADFKGGDRLFINMSDTNIGIQIGPTKVAVPARRSKIYRAPDLTKPTNMPIMYQFYHPEREEWKLLSASTVVLRPTRREIVIFNNGSRVGNIKKHKILFPLPVETP